MKTWHGHRGYKHRRIRAINGRNRDYSSAELDNLPLHFDDSQPIYSTSNDVFKKEEMFSAHKQLQRLYSLLQTCVESNSRHGVVVKGIKTIIFHTHLSKVFKDVGQ